MSTRPTLRRKLLGWLALYLGLLTTVVFGAAQYVHEHAEHAVWWALLDSELDSTLAQFDEDPDYRWQDSDTLSFFSAHHGYPIPEHLVGLTPGLHDEVDIGDQPSAILVRDTADGPVILALDITDFEELEGFITRWSLIAGVSMFAITLFMSWIGMNRLVRPLARLAGQIARLKPERSGQRIEIEARASAELAIIASAVNDYIERNDRFFERERAFISTASHELRTPIATIAGASELALSQPDVSPRTRQQLQRIRSTAAGIEHLIRLLLILARDPTRLSALSEPVALDQLLPEIVADHQHLAAGKELSVHIQALASVVILAPVGMVQAAAGNLLRNAIENSDSGVIHLSVSDDAVLTIEDPGHGMPPEQVAAVYARAAKGEFSMRSGIGLDLIQRLCEHLGWQLEIDSTLGQGTRVRLEMARSIMPVSSPPVCSPALKAELQHAFRAPDDTFHPLTSADIIARNADSPRGFRKI